MSVFEQYKQNPKDFTRLVGLDLKTFETVEKKLSAHIAQYLDDHRISKRGRKSTIPLSDQLLLTLLYVRNYQTYLHLSKTYHITESYGRKIAVKISGHLLDLYALPSKEPLKTHLYKTVLIDVTEQPIERPKRQQKAYYSGKKNAIR